MSKIIVIAHHDSDGILSSVLLTKKFGKIDRLLFASYYTLKRRLCEAILNSTGKETLYILDISIDSKNLKLASYFDEAYWFDHHHYDVIEKVPENVKVIHSSNAKSTVELLSQHFNIEFEELDIANQIDTNNVQSDLARDLRDLISAIKWKFGRNYIIHLKTLVDEIAKEGLKNVLSKGVYRILIEEYRKWLDEKESEIFTKIKFETTKIGKCIFFTLTENLPPYFLLEFLEKRLIEKFDYVFIIYRLGNTARVEVRTQTGKDVIKIAKKFGGGGHKYAAGFVIENFESIEDILKEIDK